MTGILIAFEMTHEFALVSVLMIGALISQIISRKMERESFYEAVAGGQAPPLEAAVGCRPDTPLREVADLIVSSPSGLLVLQDEVGPAGRVIGVVAMHDILRAQKMFAHAQRD